MIVWRQILLPVTPPVIQADLPESRAAIVCNILPFPELFDFGRAMKAVKTTRYVYSELRDLIFMSHEGVYDLSHSRATGIVGCTGSLLSCVRRSEADAMGICRVCLQPKVSRAERSRLHFLQAHSWNLGPFVRLCADFHRQ